jgi:ABC-type bacteriocin/lantibiotic exporter with double-glycine peptidase domain
MTDVECGAACLAMILGYFGRRVSIGEIAAEAGAGRDGLTAAAIVRAAREVGLRVRAFSIGAEACQLSPLPAIAYWSSNHFVVVERVTERHIEIVDPASGRRRLSHNEFAAGFSRVLLICEPLPVFQRQAVRGTSHARRLIVRHVLGHRALLGQIVAATLALQFVGLLPPLCSRIVIDRVLPSVRHDLLTVVALGMGGIVLTQWLLSLVRAKLLIRLQRRVDANLSEAFVGHLLSLPFRFFDHRSTGDLMSRTAAVAQVRQTLTTQLLAAVLDGSLAITYLAILFACDSGMGLIVVTVAALHVAILLASKRRMHELAQRELTALAAEQATLIETFAGIATVKAAGGEGRALARWSQRFGVFLDASLRRGQTAAQLESLHNALRAAAPLALLWLGAQRVMTGEMTLGTMLALTALATAALSPISSLVLSALLLQSVGAQLDRLSDVLETAPETRGNITITAPKGRIELRDAGFRYQRDAPWVFRNLSVTIEPRTKVALVGRSGSGKSTLAKLLLGLYEPVEGELFLDGIALPDLDRTALRRSIGAVLQEPSLFRGSIRDNVSAHDPGASDERVWEALRIAALDDEIRAMPMGLETRLGESGAGISGGQRQRIALARAVLARPAVLLLDEATSHLDTATESRVERELSEIDCTRIVIAHRLSTVREADVILVLDAGQLVERGCHDELVCQDGLYAALVRNQTQTHDLVAA